MANQLFLKIPEKELVLEILKLFGINDFNDNNYFTKKTISQLNIVDKMNNYKTKLSFYYIPCKSKLYLENITLPILNSFRYFIGGITSVILMNRCTILFFNFFKYPSGTSRSLKLTTKICLIFFTREVSL